MNRERAARAYNTIAEGFAELALAVLDDSAGAGVPPRPAPVAPLAEEPPIGDQFDYDDRSTKPIGNQHVENVLGQCPNHQKPWTIKPAGVSKAGKPYGAFWKCSEKDESTRSGYCDKKPAKAWEDTHPASAAA